MADEKNVKQKTSEKPSFGTRFVNFFKNLNSKGISIGKSSRSYDKSSLLKKVYFRTLYKFHPLIYNDNM